MSLNSAPKDVGHANVFPGHCALPRRTFVAADTKAFDDGDRLSASAQPIRALSSNKTCHLSMIFNRRIRQCWYGCVQMNRYSKQEMQDCLAIRYGVVHKIKEAILRSPDNWVL